MPAQGDTLSAPVDLQAQIDQRFEDSVQGLDPTKEITDLRGEIEAKAHADGKSDDERREAVYMGLLGYGQKFIHEGGDDGTGAHPEEVRDAVFQNLVDSGNVQVEFDRVFAKRGIDTPTPDELDAEAEAYRADLLRELTAPVGSRIDRLRERTSGVRERVGGVLKNVVRWPKKALKAKEAYTKKAAAQRAVYRFDTESATYDEAAHEEAKALLTTREGEYRAARNGLLGTTAIGGAVANIIGGNLLTDASNLKLAAVGAGLGLAGGEAKLRYNKRKESEDQRKGMREWKQAEIDQYREGKPDDHNYDEDEGYQKLMAELDSLTNKGLRDKVSVRWAEWNARLATEATIGATRTAGFLKRTLDKIKGDGLWEKGGVSPANPDSYSEDEADRSRTLHAELRAIDPADTDAVEAKEAEIAAFESDMNDKYGEKKRGRPTHRGVAVAALGVLGTAVAGVVAIKVGGEIIDWIGDDKKAPRKRSGGSDTATSTTTGGSGRSTTTDAATSTTSGGSGRSTTTEAASTTTGGSGRSTTTTEAATATTGGGNGNSSTTTEAATSTTAPSGNTAPPADAIPGTAPGSRPNGTSGDVVAQWPVGTTEAQKRSFTEGINKIHEMFPETKVRSGMTPQEIQTAKALELEKVNQALELATKLEEAKAA